MAYTIVTYLVYRLTLKSKMKSIIHLDLLLFKCYFGCLPQPLEKCFCETGSANYLWGSLIILSFLYVYHREIIEEHVFTKTKLMIFDVCFRNFGWLV